MHQTSFSDLNKSKVLKYPNKILSTKTKKVDKFDNSIRSLIKDMKKIMILENGIGLAANQVGSTKRLFVAKVDNDILEFINPKILTFSEDTCIMNEGCLSFPDKYLQIERPREIILEYWDENRNKHLIHCEGILSRCVQHEIDHLDGITIEDRYDEQFNPLSGNINNSSE